MELINNTTKTLRDDLAVEIKQGSRLSIAAACFSIYAFQELKDELWKIEDLRFIFTSPTFVTEKTEKAMREFYIPRLNRERSLYGTEFEIKLRNELTQKAIAKECAEWIRQKVTFKSNVTNEGMLGFINLDDKSYSPVQGFTTVDLAVNVETTPITSSRKRKRLFRIFTWSCSRTSGMMRKRCRRSRMKSLKTSLLHMPRTRRILSIS